MWELCVGGGGVMDKSDLRCSLIVFLPDLTRLIYIRLFSPMTATTPPPGKA